MAVAQSDASARVGVGLSIILNRELRIVNGVLCRKNFKERR